MDKAEYQTMFDVEDQYWWYRGLRQLVFSSIDQYFPSEKPVKLLDAGCGTGGLLSHWVHPYVGLDFSREALLFCREKRINALIQASVEDIPLKDNSFDCAVSLDVLCNVKDDGKALRELFRVLRPNGILILNLPAYESLKSSHDRAVHIEHRYRLKPLREKLRQNGFKIEKATYRNTFLFPPIAMKRLWDRFASANQAQPASDLTPFPKWLNDSFTSLLSWENRMLRRINFPYGLSVFCVARKP